jgi:hypothetical protein
LRSHARTRRWGLGAVAAAAALALSGLGTTVGLGQTVAAQQSRADAEDGVQVLTRGPVHEAFAETITFDPEPGMVVAKAPPESIEELPPDQRPDGVNVDWIPGYWAWDDERGDFLWISGVWRALPPGREWVPGYWGRTDQGFQWASGYWADAQADEIEYLPEPPATVEVGPNIAPPSAGDIWIPGSWVWYQGRYAWRPGYWVTVQPDWDWVPAHYVWARRGYVFVDGYWDYSVARRGVLFAPVYFDSSVYVRRGFTYSPATVINLSVFSDHLFVRPRYNHYYFGDYYAPSYRDAGFYTAFSFHSGRRGYDPVYAHQRWRHRQDPEWGRRVEANFSHRRDHEDARPPRTLVAQRKLVSRAAQPPERTRVVATSLDQLAKRRDTPLQFQPLGREERQTLTRRGKEIQSYREDRRRLEAAATDPPDDRPGREHGPTRVKVRKSPFVGTRGVSPQRPEPPPPDPNVQPKPRKAGGHPESARGERKVKKDRDKHK